MALEGTLSSDRFMGYEDIVGCAVCGYALFRNGTRTESSISSYIFATAGSSLSGDGGISAGASEGERYNIGSRTLEGRFTSREPFGLIYASTSRCQSACTYSRSFAEGEPVPARPIIFA